MPHATCCGHLAAALAAMADGQLLFMENEHYALVDALPYIDTQLGSMEVAQQVKALIDEEMALFEPRDYLADLPAPEMKFLSSEAMKQEMARVEAGLSLTAVNVDRYQIEQPQGMQEGDHGSWRKNAEAAQMQLEYNRLRLTNLEMLERWGGKAWIAHSAVVRASERVLATEAAGLRATREEVNKKRKLDHVSCGNELRRLAHELERYRQDNAEVERGLAVVDAEVQRLRQAAVDRGVDIDSIDPEFADLKKRKAEEDETME